MHFSVVTFVDYGNRFKYNSRASHAISYLRSIVI
jgi:hypothetical protein